MDIRRKALHYPTMYTDSPLASRDIPTYRLYRERSGESGDFWLHCETIPARTHLHNFEINAHRHDALFQIFLVTEGSGELVEDGRARQFAAPCVLFIAPGAVHGFRYQRDVDGIVVTALADRLRAIADADRRIAAFTTANRVVSLDDGPAAKRILGCLWDISAELDNPAPGRMPLLEALMATAIVGLARVDGAADEEAPAPVRRDQARVERFIALIGAHMREHQPVGFYAERLGLSPTHLNRLVREVTGMSAQNLIARRLLEAAKRDLVFTPSPVQKIAYSLGFADPAYFNRFFRRHAGTTPGAYRETERKVLAA